MKTTERHLKTRRPSKLSRGIGLLICASIPLQPAYGLAAARPGSFLSGSSAVAPIFEPVVGGGRLGEDLDFGKGTDGELKLPSMPAPKPGACRPPLPNKLIQNPKEQKFSLRAPILNDVGPCDSEKVDKCLTMLHSSLTNHQQALVGSDESRDELLDIGDSRLSYTKNDILTISRVLRSWTEFTKGYSPSPASPTNGILTADEILLQKILTRMAMEPGKGNPTREEETEIARIHLHLSEQLTIAAEASLDPHFVDYRNAAALLAAINPSASAAFSCLLGFKKSATEVPFGKKRVILGYFSGNVYAELDDAERQNPAIAAAAVGALIGGGFLLVGKIIDTINEHNKMVQAEKLHNERIAHEASESAKARAHEASESAKARALEREKAGLPPETPAANPPKASASSSGDSKKPGASSEKPHTTTDNGKPKEDDMFKPFPGSDYDPKDNKHYDTTLGCSNGLFEALDRSDPKKHPELVTDYANPDDISGAWQGNGQDLNLGLSREDLYTDYGNPADFTETERKVISLDEFRKPSTNVKKECLQIKTTEPVSGQSAGLDPANSRRPFGA